MTIEIDPVAKPRQTRSDKWKQRPAVMRYRAYADELRMKVPAGYQLPANVQLVFGIPMPRSWSAKKKAEMDGQPHQQKPDTDNLTKAVKDVLCDDDSYVWRELAEKRWSQTGYVTIRPL
jgi:Holliday junction resolvase RusA-like endonuclease